MLREVRNGATYVITDRGEPIAEIAARREPRWVPSDGLDTLLREMGGDETWAKQIAESRTAVNIAGPWERGE